MEMRTPGPWLLPMAIADLGWAWGQRYLLKRGDLPGLVGNMGNMIDRDSIWLVGNMGNIMYRVSIL